VPESVSIRPRLNWAILVTAIAADLVLLWYATHADSIIARVAAAMVFAFTNNTIFSLLHEAVHRSFDTNRVRNEVAGYIAALFFPTSLTMQRAFHMTHHHNNRGEEERFDFLAPGENVLLKTTQWFSILTGVYGLSAPAFGVIYFCVADLVPWHKLVQRGSQFANQTSAHAYLDAILQLPVARVRAEVAAYLLFHVSLGWVLNLSWAGWLLCYCAFAIVWSSQQYANHAYTVLDRDDGAWNIRVSRLTRFFFLNYHDHLAHHLDTARPWNRLPDGVTAQQPTVPLLDILYLMWKGPKLLPGAAQPAERQSALDAWTVVAHVLVFAVIFAAVYGSSSAAYSTIGQTYAVATPWDALLPFVPQMATVYLSLNLLMLVTPIVLRSPERTLPFLVTLVAQVLIGWLGFHLYPVTLPDVPALEPGSLTAAIFRIADAANLNGNGLPSLHTAFAISCAWVCAPLLRGWRALSLWAWALAVVASTVLTKQHYLADVVAGALLAVVAMRVLHPRLERALGRIERYVHQTQAAVASR
jgi:membrane-associated phospholipid phosphatase/fatty acid desaturase